MLNLSFSRSKLNQNVIFECKQFFKFWQEENFLIQNLTRCIFFQSKIWRVVKLSNKNLMRCIFFILKSVTYKFLSESCFSKGIFRFSLNFYQTATNIKEWLVGNWRPLGVKDFFTSVWYVFSHFCYYLFGYCVLYGAWVLDGCDDYIICATNWFIQISLALRKWLVYKDFILKDTKLLV